jgi:hypothetical protein
MTIGDKIYNMESVGMFYLASWCVKCLRLYKFSRGINIPLVHPLHGATERNCKQWFSTRFNSRQWERIFAIM